MADAITINLTVPTPQPVAITMAAGPKGDTGAAGANGTAGAAGATGATGPAPAGTGLVSVSGGALDTPSTLAARLLADASNLRNALGLGTAATQSSTYFSPLGGNISLTTIGTIGIGTWNATIISGQYGGTGVANTGKTLTLGGNLSTASAIAFSCTGSVAFVGPTAAVTITLPSSSAWLARTDAAQTFAGVQTFSSVPVFSALTRTSVYLNAAQTLTVSVYDIVKFDTVEFGSGFNTGTNTYTVPYTGYLKVTGAIGVNVCSGGLFVVTVYNGSTRVKRCFSSNNYMSGSINPFSVIIPVTAADSITIRVYSSPAAQLFNNSFDTWCQFEMLPN